MGSRSVFAAACFLSFFSLPAAAAAQESPGPLAIVGATIIDGHGGAPIVDGTIVIEGDRIAAVGPSADVAVPEGAEVIDGSGKFVTPGFVDTNVHMSLAFGRGGRVEEHAAYWAHHEALILQGLQLHLKHGVTTVRDSYGVLRPMQRVKKRIDSGEDDRPAHLSGRQHRGLGRSGLRDVRRAPGVGDQLLRGADERRGHARKRRRDDAHDARRAARRDQCLSRPRAGLHQVRRHAPLQLSGGDLVLAARPAGDRRGDAQARARRRDPRHEPRRPAPLDPRGDRPHPAPGQRREPHDHR